MYFNIICASSASLMKSMTRFGMKLALSQIQGPKRILALDVGTLNTGVAVSCPQLKQSYVKSLY